MTNKCIIDIIYTHIYTYNTIYKYDQICTSVCLCVLCLLFWFLVPCLQVGQPNMPPATHLPWKEKSHRPSGIPSLGPSKQFKRVTVDVMTAKTSTVTDRVLDWICRASALLFCRQHFFCFLPCQFQGARANVCRNDTSSCEKTTALWGGSLQSHHQFLATRWNHSMNMQLQRHKGKWLLRNETNFILFRWFLFPLLIIQDHMPLIIASLVAPLGNALLHQTHRQMSHIATNICHT